MKGRKREIMKNIEEEKNPSNTPHKAKKPRFDTDIVVAKTEKSGIKTSASEKDDSTLVPSTSSYINKGPSTSMSHIQATNEKKRVVAKTEKSGIKTSASEKDDSTLLPSTSSYINEGPSTSMSHIQATNEKKRKKLINEGEIEWKKLKSVPDDDKRNENGETFLHSACRSGKMNIVMELLKQGANPNTQDHAGRTPIHEAVVNNDLALLKLLLQYDTLVDVPGFGDETPLHEAVRLKHKEIAIELVKNGANIHAQNCRGHTPMGMASREMKALILRASSSCIYEQRAKDLAANFMALTPEPEEDESDGGDSPPGAGRAFASHLLNMTPPPSRSVSPTSSEELPSMKSSSGSANSARHSEESTESLISALIAINFLSSSYN